MNYNHKYKVQNLICLVFLLLLTSSNECGKNGRVTTKLSFPKISRQDSISDNLLTNSSPVEKTIFSVTFDQHYQFRGFNDSQVVGRSTRL